MSIFLRPIAITAVLATACPPSFAAGAPAASHPCAEIAPPSDRLACYDSAFPRPDNGRAQETAPIDERSRALREFGLSREQLRKRDPERIREIAPDRVEAKLARVVKTRSGQRMVTLDNGQTWLLTEVTSKGRIKPGDPIVVKRAALGSFMIVTEAGIRLRARRLK